MRKTFNFLDERICISIVILWIIFVCIIVLCLFDSLHFEYGPNENLKIFNIEINTWLRWSCVCSYIIINQSIETYGLNVISPWLINDIQNKNQTEQKYSEFIIQLINVFWELYLWLTYVISLRLYFTQIDFICLLLIMDCLMTCITTHFYLKYKKYSPYNILETLLVNRLSDS